MKKVYNTLSRSCLNGESIMKLKKSDLAIEEGRKKKVKEKKNSLCEGGVGGEWGPTKIEKRGREENQPRGSTMFVPEGLPARKTDGYISHETVFF